MVVKERPDPGIAQSISVAKGPRKKGRGLGLGGGGVSPLRWVRGGEAGGARLEGGPGPRWVVGGEVRWFEEFPALLIRYDKKAENYLGLIQLACALLWSRRLHRLGWGKGVCG